MLFYCIFNITAIRLRCYTFFANLYLLFARNRYLELDLYYRKQNYINTM